MSLLAVMQPRYISAQYQKKIFTQKEQTVRASFYSDKFENRLMSNGKKFHQNVKTAASTQFPLGSIVRIKSLKTGRIITVEITDRGPWNRKFGLDLSKSAFSALGLSLTEGWGWVTVANV